MWRDLDSNFTYDCRIETGSVAESERVCEWMRQHGHRVMRPWALRDYVIVRGSSYKLGSICEHHFPGMAFSFTLVSQPVGFERGEWVVMRNIGVVGQVAWEYGYNGRHSDENTLTGLNITVGSATWSARADCVVRLSELPEAVADELRSIGERQATNWQHVSGHSGDREAQEAQFPDKQRAFALVTEAVPA